MVFLGCYNGEDQVAGLFGGEECLHIGLVGEVELGLGADGDGGDAESKEEEHRTEDPTRLRCTASGESRISS